MREMNHYRKGEGGGGSGSGSGGGRYIGNSSLPTA